ncbi:Protein CBG18619 [Caenorhabditis briggsae]|uniref:Protein CBG18619 n=2 Tax=Caenorhabditis briggsae TaxID=6238 RepID=A8XTQ6_CAEBR|nr:Protein CBG18619 [Caenorhabditis briggsae]ULT92224.1 hypothetical protein L3Y34_009757 [Caenorhabditis briggsae]CAP36032.2 Protein CBG18619 [Caenorhabditis briggsae]
MVSWSQFPPEIKRKIAENYDFMSRNSMRNTCHVDRQIVDSTKFRIPRVRFGYKQDECLICIYTGIEKFLRLEILKFENGVVVFKSENSHYLTDSTRKFIPFALSLNEGLLILKSLLAHKSIQISTMEWELEDCNIDKLGKQMKKLLGISKFSVKELELAMGTDEIHLRYLEEICDWNKVEIIRKFGIILHSKSMNLISAYDYGIVDFVSGKAMYFTHYYTHDPRVDLDALVDQLNRRIEENGDGELYWFTHREPSDKDWSFSEDYRFKDGNVTHSKRSPCGMWVNRCQESFAKELKAIHDTQKCGIGSLCPKHADPFDYWYHQNLPRRLIQEPFWNGFIEKCFFPTLPIDLNIF